MTFDRFDICEAWFQLAADFHTGQGSELYAVFGRLNAMGFKARPSLRSYDDLSENAKEIYDSHAGSLWNGYHACSCGGCGPKGDNILGGSPYCGECRDAGCTRNQPQCEDPEDEDFEDFEANHDTVG